MHFSCFLVCNEPISFKPHLHLLVVVCCNNMHVSMCIKPTFVYVNSELRSDFWGLFTIMATWFLRSSKSKQVAQHCLDTCPKELWTSQNPAQCRKLLNIANAILSVVAHKSPVPRR